MPIIGIVAPKHFEGDNLPFNDFTRYTNNFPNRIYEAGGTPIGLFFSDGKFHEDAAEICDGFLLQGGPDVESAGINVIHYAIKHNKPLLGVCLGMQTMAGYEWIIKELGENPTYEEIDKFYKHEFEDEFLYNVDNHDLLDPFEYDNRLVTKHKVYLNNSCLSKIFNSDELFVPSLHKQAAKEKIFEDSKHFTITGRAEDNTIEVIEAKELDNWIVGVQFHPEIEKENIDLFKVLVESAKKHQK